MHFCTISLRNNLLATKQNEVTIISSLLFSLVGFCSPQQVKFHLFCSSIHGNEKWLSKYFLPSLSVHCIFYQANKNISVIYTLNFNNHPILLWPLKQWERRSYNTVPKYKDVCQLYLFIANLFILHVFHLFVVDQARALMRRRKSRDKDFDFLLFSLPIIPCSCHRARHVRRLGMSQSVKYCEQAQ